MPKTVDWSSRAVMILAAGLWLHSARAAPMPTPVSDPAAVAAAAAAAVQAAQDAATRMTIAVMVNGHGPYPFVVDTGADRTVISSALAATLKLPPGRIVRLHDAHGVANVPTAVLDSVSFGGREVHGVEAPVLDALNLGADGMLGIDCLHDQRVTLDFSRQSFKASASPHQADTSAPGTIVVYGKRRFGQLVLVDAEANGEPIFVILDSGAQNTLGNAALQRLLFADNSHKPEVVDVLSVLGSHTPADLNEVAEMRLGGIIMRHVPIAYADLETFRQFGLTNQPAMLLGMDVLHLFTSVSVDFRLREAVFVPK